MPWIVAAAATIAAIAAGAYAVAKRPTPDTRVYTASILVPTPLAGAPVRRLNISPDGRRLAFVAPLDAGGQPVLWVRPLGDAQAQPLRGTEGAGSPFWSADSRWIAFQADGKLKKVEAAGGTVTTVSDVVETPPGTWNADNVILMTGPGNVIVRVPASGGTPVAVTVPRPETGEAIHLTPSFLPDGRHFLYAGARLGTMVSSIYVASIDSKETTRLTEGAVPQYANGHLVFLRGSMLMAQPFDPDRLTLSGEARPLAERVQINTATGTGAFSVAQTGALVFQGSGGVDSSSRLLWVDRGGKSLGPIGEPGQFGDLQLSPDARWASATRIESDGVLDVWLFDVARNLPRRFTVDGKGGFSAVWHPDGKRIAYAVRRAKTFDLVERAMDGSGVETVLLSDEVGKYPIGYSPDGRSLVYMNQAGATRGRLWVLSLADRQPRQLFPSQEPMQMSAEISPDGRWIAYASVTEEGRSSLYVASFPGGSAKREIPAVRGAATPHWRRDGRELFFTVPGRFMAVDVDTSSAAAETGAPHVLFEVSVPAPALGLRSTYAPAPDAQRFLFRSWAESGTAAAPITLVLNWTQLLRQ